MVKNKWKMIVNLTINDFQSKYAGSFFSYAWAFILPLINLLVMWYVFQIGLRSSDTDGVPFIVWFAPASLAWTFFSESIVGATASLKEYSYLVKKVSFNVELLPIIKVLSNCIAHLALLLFVFVLSLIYKIDLKVYSIQIVYYFVSMIMLTIALGYLFSALMPFVNDLQSVVSVIVQIGFWATPIVWNINYMSNSSVIIAKANPMCYIVTGYRDSLFNYIWFWERPAETAYFWVATITTYILGKYIFRRMRPQFADVL